jgi:ankyrin repeat protein
MWAARSGDVDTVDLLLKAGADVDRATPFDATPLIAPAQAGHVEVVRRRLAAGADANHRTRSWARRWMSPPTGSDARW